MRRACLVTILVLVGLISSVPAAAATAAAPVAASSATPTTGTAARTLSPLTFGARGDGVTDDTAALQHALDALRAGDTLALPAGRTFRHTDVLRIGVAGVRVTGPGVLLATAESRSAVLVAADRVVLDGGLVLRAGPTTRRWDAFEQMKLRIAANGVVVRRVTVEGAAAAGVYVGTGAHDFLLEDVVVRGTRADGIHITGGAHDGVVRRPVVQRSGDDGVAVVSYQGDGVPVRRVLVDSPNVSDTTWGRGVTVVGGEDITYRDVTVRRSNAAAVYIASEGAPYFTFAPRRVTVEGALLEGANINASVGHGAVLVYAGRPNHSPSQISLSSVTVRSTRTTAPWQVGVVGERGSSVQDLRFARFDVHGAPAPFSSNLGTAACSLVGWTVNGSAVADTLSATTPAVPAAATVRGGSRTLRSAPLTR
ncbi:glycosyl hydrolase family 28-related protein [Kineococcus aurantiacus]|uniref:Rhamnogalacturonase A/B/Epimerase-like pectate lyase domain-containing protein n=1 Tax=Kineococcus aurantiacus TaxID=37633 RepID=A0A7Y9DPK2_9ACTN|nr:glycosyl hydrolase family 28-related protein [Kineococcus aurantiacus]NYD24430.1 hypothetical protein [Kineococcus aurantiacus]